MDSAPDEQHSRLTIGEDLADTRLDRAVAQWRGLSRSAALRLLEAGAIRRNGRAVAAKDKGTLLVAGDLIEVDPRFARGEAPLPDPGLRIDVLTQAEGWLVVNKPAGVAVRPHKLDETGTVINAVAARCPSVVGVGEGGLRSGVVHRLDNDTSGALAVATEEVAWGRLRSAFAEHRVLKRYEALVLGSPPQQGTQQLRLRVTQHAPARVRVCGPDEDERDASDCSLSWRVLERFANHASHIEVDLHTGFLHQIRVMMAHLGWPVIGDQLYGPTQPAHTAPRQMLHARRLEVEGVVAQAPLPTDFVGVIQVLRGS